MREPDDGARAPRELGPGNGLHDRHPRLRLVSEPLERLGARGPLPSSRTSRTPSSRSRRVGRSRAPAPASADRMRRNSPRRDSAAGSRSFRSGPPPVSEPERLVGSRTSRQGAGRQTARKPLPWKGKRAERRGRPTPPGPSGSGVEDLSPPACPGRGRRGGRTGRRSRGRRRGPRDRRPTAGRFQSSESALKVAAAFELPPPSPPPMGIFLER